MAGNNFQKVLLLGNGINRAYNSGSWDELLSKIGDSSLKSKETNIPNPLRAILASDDNIDRELKRIQTDPKEKHLLYGEICDSKQISLLQEILNIGFNNILTTNYSYELESAAFNKKPCLNEKKLIEIQQHSREVTRAERKYLLHTYNEIKTGQNINRIWHIHGEARKCDSIILGHYYYGSLLYKYKELLNGRKNSYEKIDNENTLYDSWIDAFILSDVYILGFSFDFSELDLWWLLNRKKRERALHGKVYYYSPKADDEKDKIELLKAMYVECRDLEFSCFKNEDSKVLYSIGDEHSFYSMFYEAAIKDITARIKN